MKKRSVFLPHLFVERETRKRLVSLNNETDEAL